MAASMSGEPYSVSICIQTEARVAFAASLALDRASQAAHAANSVATHVAIAAIVFYGLFQHMIQKTENEMIESSMSLMNLIASNRDKMKD